ncbi:MAG: phosphoribosyl-AMP cyclohydrolase [Candidatus Firestonebacteria bacterium]
MFKFDKDGLIPAIIQDINNSDVLMLAYMNKEAIIKTINTGKVYFYSRSRKKLWQKGETSGNILLVREIYTDCDADVILIKVKFTNKAACHTGYRSCFYRKFHISKVTAKNISKLFSPVQKNHSKFVKITGKKMFNPKEVYGV